MPRSFRGNEEGRKWLVENSFSCSQPPFAVVWWTKREHSPGSYSSSEISQPSEISAPDDGQAENLCVNSLEGHVLANSGLTRPSAAIISGTGSQTIGWWVASVRLFIGQCNEHPDPPQKIVQLFTRYHCSLDCTGQRNEYHRRRLSTAQNSKLYQKKDCALLPKTCGKLHKFVPPRL